MLQRVNQTLAEYSHHGNTILRVGLGVVILLAGAHKILQPAVWSAYAAPWAVDIITAIGGSMDMLMRGNGVVEALLGLAIISDQYTALAAGLVSLSLLGIVVNLVTAGTVFVDVLIRDIGLFVLAVGVALMAAGRARDSGASF